MFPDLRRFEVFPLEIDSLMDEFELGKALSYSVEEGINHHHSNKVVFVKSDNGKEYVLKFYMNNERPIRFYIQFLVVSRLIRNGFKTCRMHLTKDKKPFFKVRDHFVSAYDRLDAVPILYKNFDELNKEEILKLLSALRERLTDVEKKFDFRRHIISDFYKKYDFPAIFKSLPKKSDLGSGVGLDLRGLCKRLDANLSPHKNKNPVSFVHSEVSLKNMLYDGRQYYLIDFDHLGYDYEHQEFGNFIVNLYLNKVKQGPMPGLISKYYNAHTLDNTGLNFLFSIISFELMREYIKLSKRLDDLIHGRRPKNHSREREKGLNKEELISQGRNYLCYIGSILSELSEKVE